MIIGIPKEIKEDEYRVGIVPPGVRTLTEHGHSIIIEKGAGDGCRITDGEYMEAGATIVESPVEVYDRSDMIMKVKEPQPSEFPLFHEGQILYAYLHLAPAPQLADALLSARIIAVAYETIQNQDGFLPLLVPMSEVAGKMSVQVGAHFLEKTQGGRGVSARRGPRCEAGLCNYSRRRNSWNGGGKNCCRNGGECIYSGCRPETSNLYG